MSASSVTGEYELDAVLPSLIRGGASRSLCALLEGVIWHANLMRAIGQGFWRGGVPHQIPRTVKITFGRDSIPQATSPNGRTVIYLPLEEQLRLVALCWLIVESICDKYFRSSVLLSEECLWMVRAILQKSKGLFESYDRRIYPLYDVLLGQYNLNQLLDEATCSANQIAEIGDWAVSLSRVLFVGTYGLTVEHEFAHVSRGHLAVMPELKKLELTDPDRYKLVKVGLEGEADIYASTRVRQFARLLLVENAGPFSNVPDDGLRMVLNKKDLAG